MLMCNINILNLNLNLNLEKKKEIQEIDGLMLVGLDHGPWDPI